jgi:16S rRNA (cytidine1402-2'-O)-methyltransferase
MPEEIEKGTLYIVSTPIGNLEDTSLRAVKILAGVDLIAAEDTRKTKVLLDHHHIKKEMVSYYSYNEARRIPYLLEQLRNGRAVALVSDAGTPGISDPAYRVIKEAIEEGIQVKAVPGPAAFLPALVVSGLPTHRFVFEGFLPAKKGRKARIEELSRESRTIILYESPHRLTKTLLELRDHFGDREVAVCRELTKRFEEVLRGTISEVLPAFTGRSPKGEFVLVIAGKS